MRISKYTSPATRAEIGMVSIQAHRSLIVTPQRTADTRLVAPTPMILPVIVCVVETGIPKCSDTYKVIAPAVSALTPSSEVTLVILDPIVFTIFQPPLMVPSPIIINEVNGTQPHCSTNIPN